MTRKIVAPCLIAALLLTILLALAELPRKSDLEQSAFKIEPLATKVVYFDSNGDGVDNAYAELNMLGASGGYGSFELGVFISSEEGYIKIFDDNGSINDDEAIEFLSSILDCEPQIDTYYSVEAADFDNDGCDELLCKSYVWSETHSNHIGNLITVYKVIDSKLVKTETQFSQ